MILSFFKRLIKNLLFFWSSLLIYRVFKNQIPLLPVENVEFGILGTILITVMTYFRRHQSIVLTAVFICWCIASGFVPIIKDYLFWITIIYAGIAIYYIDVTATIMGVVFIANIFYSSINLVKDIKTSPHIIESAVNNKSYSVMESKLSSKKLKCNVDNFIDDLKDISVKYKINPTHLLFLMWLESDLNPSAINKVSRAVGLIQFTPMTCSVLNYDYNDVKIMNGIQQLHIVDKYLLTNKKLIDKCDDVYMLYLVIFYPAAIYKVDHNNNDFTFPDIVAKQNPAIFRNGAGYDQLKKYIDKKMIIAGIGI